MLKINVTTRFFVLQKYVSFSKSHLMIYKKQKHEVSWISSQNNVNELFLNNIQASLMKDNNMPNHYLPLKFPKGFQRKRKRIAREWNIYFWFSFWSIFTTK